MSPSVNPLRPHLAVLAALALWSSATAAAETPPVSLAHLETCGLEAPDSVHSLPPVLPKKNEIPGIGASGLPVVRSARATGEGALVGKTIYVSPGHGWNWTGSEWRAQRPNTHGIVEDLVATEAATQYLVKYLRNMGAYVVSLRENDLNPNVAISDDSHSSFTVTAGLALREDDTGYAIPPATYEADHRPFAAGTSKVFDASFNANAGVRWTFDVPEDGNYNVYIGYVQAPDRASDAHYTVFHAGGKSEFFVDQRRHGNTWVFLGNFFFRKGASEEFGSLRLSTLSVDPGATLSADVARIGGGISSASRGGVTHGRPAFEDSALNYLQSAGAPSSVLVNDVQARSRFAAWDHEDGEDAVYIAWHTNANNGNARGTSSFAYGPSPFGSIDTFSGVEGSVELLSAVHDEVVEDLRAGWDPEWPEFGAGLFAAYFGEVNPANNPEMPAGLFEIAFHDNAEDAHALADPGFRRVAARAMAQGIARYFASRDGAGTPTFPPDEPRHLAMEQDGNRLRLRWRAPALETGGGDAALRYRVYLSSDGLAFDDGHDVDETSFVLDGSTATFARVTAINAGGESLPSPIVGARASIGGQPQILVVGDFLRLDYEQLLDEDLSDYNLDTVKRMLLGRMNDFSHLARYGRAIDAAGISFAQATVAAIRSGDVALLDYAVVIWMAGETKEQLLEAEDRDSLESYLDAGGALVMSGTHVVTALDASGAGGQAFLRDRLGIGAIFQDVGDFSLMPVEAAPPELSPMRYDDDGEHSYLAEGADGMTPGAGARVLLAYASGEAALVSTVNTGLLSFPFETIDGEDNRIALMAALTDAFGIEPDDAPEPDSTSDPDADGGGLAGGCGCQNTTSTSGSRLPWMLLIWGISCRRRRRSSGACVRSRL